MKAGTLPWTGGEDGLLRQKWVDGCTATEIARDLPLRSRCAVLGRIHRLGLAIRDRKMLKHSRAPKPKPVPAPKPPRIIATPDLDPGPSDPPITTEDLTDFHCRWPYDGKTETIYCGAMKSRSGRYCVFHAEMGRAKDSPVYKGRQVRRF